MKKPLVITGPMGGGMNHLRLLLGLADDAEIRDLAGRRLPNSDKEKFILKIMYHDRRIYTGPAPVRGNETKVWQVQHGGYAWQAQSYWLRIEWLTRDLYTDSQVLHDPQVDEGIRFVTKYGCEELVCELYRAKCPYLNGNTWEQQLNHARAFNTLSDLALPVYLPDFYSRDWCDQHLGQLTDKLGWKTIDPSLAQRVHHRWCELNQLLTQTRSL